MNTSKLTESQCKAVETLVSEFSKLNAPKEVSIGLFNVSLIIEEDRVKQNDINRIKASDKVFHKLLDDMIDADSIKLNSDLNKLGLQAFRWRDNLAITTIKNNVDNFIQAGPSEYHLIDYKCIRRTENISKTSEIVSVMLERKSGIMTYNYKTIEIYIEKNPNLQERIAYMYERYGKKLL